MDLQSNSLRHSDMLHVDQDLMTDLLMIVKC